ncbi:MAG: NfeD family protein [Bacilli bacterium]|nr:NfeD family protein [Bacilli bacterium]
MFSATFLEMLGLTEYQFILILWGLLIIVSIVVELITDELTIIWGTVGAISALISAIFKAPIWLQLIIFVVFTVGFILVFKPIIQKNRKIETIHTNADRVIGMVAVITKDFKNDEIGSAIVNGQIWRAVSTSNEEFVEGEKVQVDGLTGTKIIVSKIKNENIIKL